MKKFISILLVFAVVASLMSVCGFAADADAMDSANGLINKIIEVYADTVGPVVDEINCSINDIIFDTGFNGVLTSIDSFMEGICVAIVELVATIENLFK